MRLELGSEGRYGLRALIFLARTDERATRDAVAEGAQIPRRLLARVLARLAQAGLVESHEGRGGGSRLARPAERITLRDAVEALEGPFEVTRCIMEQRACGDGAPCAIHEAWEEGQEAILDHLEDQTLSEFISHTVPGIFEPPPNVEVRPDEDPPVRAADR